MIYDINLIPKYKAKSAGGSNTILLVITAAVVIALLLFGYYFPYQEKLQLKNRIDRQEEALKACSDTEASFVSLQNGIEKINATDMMMDTIKSNPLRLTDMLNAIENSIPTDIIIRTMTLEAGMLTIDGTTPDYTKIAAFIVNLRKLEQVLGVTLLSAQTNPSGISENPTQDEAAEQTFDFSIYVNYNDTDALAGLLATGEAMVNTQGSEAVPGEAD